MVNIFIFMMGAIIGSFLNVCIHRMPKGSSVVNPPSHCPQCSKPIHWYDNIPILSYILLAGRCRSCRCRIRLRYPVVELLTASLTLLLFAVFGLDVKFFTYSIFIYALIVATYVDFEIQEIPDEISIGGLLLGLMLCLAFPSIMNEVSRAKGLFLSVVGAIAGGGSIFLMGAAGSVIFKKEAMGGGDVKLMAMIGSFLGWKLVILTFFIAPVFGAAVGVILKLKDGREIIPYGPYLSLAALVALLYGDRILGLLLYGSA